MQNQIVEQVTRNKDYKLQNVSNLIKSVKIPLNPIIKNIKKQEVDHYLRLEQAQIWQNKVITRILGITEVNLRHMIINKSVAPKDLEVLISTLDSNDDNFIQQEDQVMVIRQAYKIGGIPLVIPHQYQHMSFPQNPLLFYLGLKNEIKDDPKTFIQKLTSLVSNDQAMIKYLGQKFGVNIILHKNIFPDIKNFVRFVQCNCDKAIHLLKWSKTEFPDMIKIVGSQFNKLLFNWYIESNIPMDVNICSIPYNENNIRKAKNAEWKYLNGDELITQIEDKISEKSQLQIKQNLIPVSNTEISQVNVNRNLNSVKIVFGDSQEQEVVTRDFQKLCEKMNKQQLERVVELVKEVPIFYCDPCSQYKKNFKFLKIDALKHHVTLQGNHFCKMLKVFQPLRPESNKNLQGFSDSRFDSASKIRVMSRGKSKPRNQVAFSQIGRGLRSSSSQKKFDMVNISVEYLFW